MAMTTHKLPRMIIKGADISGILREKICTLVEGNEYVKLFGVW